jgi:DNA invertase Pin-like site-specific DNA recombinase
MGIGLAAAVEIVKRIVDAKAQFRSLAEPWADTGTSTGRLMLAVLGGLADVKRDLIHTRTAEGRSVRSNAGSTWADPRNLALPIQPCSGRFHHQISSAERRQELLSIRDRLER